MACILRISYIYRANESKPRKEYLCYTHSPDDLFNWLLTVDIYRGLLWSTIELGVAILCSCLPTMRPLVPHGIFTKLYESYFKSSRKTVSMSGTVVRRSANRKFASSDTESGQYLDLEQENINLHRVSWSDAPPCHLFKCLAFIWVLFCSLHVAFLNTTCISAMSTGINW